MVAKVIRIGEPVNDSERQLMLFLHLAEITCFLN